MTPHIVWRIFGRLYHARATRQSDLLIIGENLARWKDAGRKEKAICETMSFFNKFAPLNFAKLEDRE